MYSLIIVLVIIASLLMCGIVLIQESKGGGLASSYSSANLIAGVRKTTDFLEKGTWGLAIAMVLLSVLSAAFAPKATKTDAPIEIAAPTQTDATNMQSFPAAGAQQKNDAPATEAAPAATEETAPAAEAPAAEAPAEN